MSGPCDVKKYFDTEFAATVAASRATHDYGHELVPYKCGGHWHLANADRKQSSRVRTTGRMYCDVCDTYMKRGRWSAHEKTKGHLEKKKETRKEPLSGMVS